MGAISAGILGLTVFADGNPEHARSRGNDAQDFYRRGSGIVEILAGLDAFDALVQVEGGFGFLLVGDDAVEEIRSHRPDRGRGIRYHGLRGGVSSESQTQNRDGNKSTFEHDAKWRGGGPWSPL